MIKTIPAYVVCCDACGLEHDEPRFTLQGVHSDVVYLVQYHNWTQPPTDANAHWCPTCSAKIFGEKGKA